MLNRYTIFAAVVCLMPLSPMLPHLVQTTPHGQTESIRGPLPSVVNIISFVTDASAASQMNAGNVRAVYPSNAVTIAVGEP